MGVIAIFPELRERIGPRTDKLYAVLPAGVLTRTPSPINFLIIIFLPTLRLIEAVCLLCLKREFFPVFVFVYNW